MNRKLAFVAASVASDTLLSSFVQQKTEKTLED